MTSSLTTLKQPSTELSAVLAKARAAQTNKGRLIFAVDATYSRQETWDLAAKIQGDMFVAAVGLALQLVYFRGHDEFKAEPWCDHGLILARAMSGVGCKAGNTQIRKVLEHALSEHKRQPINGIVYIGDRFEDRRDKISSAIAAVHTAKIPVMVFHEGGEDPDQFQWLAGENGFVAPFDPTAVNRIKQLFGQVAQFAIGKVKISELQAAARLQLTHYK
jgi:hypothetical protein